MSIITGRTYMTSCHGAAHLCVLHRCPYKYSLTRRVMRGERPLLFETDPKAGSIRPYYKRLLSSESGRSAKSVELLLSAKSGHSISEKTVV